MIEAVVFDMDGVLVDSEPVWERVRRAFTASHGGRWAPDAQDRMMGMSTAEWSAYMSEDFGIPLAARRGRRAGHRGHEGGVPGPPAAAARRGRGRPRPGGPLAARGREFRAQVAYRGRSRRLRAARPPSPPRCRAKRSPSGKPAPDVYLEACARLGIPAASCAAIEDSSNGLRSAAAAGCTVIAVPRPEYPPAADALKLARVVLDSLTKLTPDTIAAL